MKVIFMAQAVLLLWAIVPAADGGIDASIPVGSAVSSYNIADVSLPNRFLPGPQYCPDTGRTLCTHVDHYPAERIYDVLMSSRSKHFNLSSLFVDERQGDAEPNIVDNFPIVLPPAFDHHKRICRAAAVVKVKELAVLDLTETILNCTERSISRQTLPITCGTHMRPLYDIYILSIESILCCRGLAKQATENVEQACPFRVRYIPVRAALNDRSQWKFIVNVPERDVRVTQFIRVEVCEYPDEPCSSTISLPHGYVSKCRQKYLKKKLLSLDADGGGTSEEDFFVPSCCVCELIREDTKK
ncbi:uncharacterized protein LOC135369482 [Ornithodoros turicata]|uniref:uncharacterized protein LOC135369482 n=1 Tax=Ornithodoros turicata TaxID=34597 RepID=UPI0031388F21